MRFSVVSAAVALSASFGHVAASRCKPSTTRALSWDAESTLVPTSSASAVVDPEASATDDKATGVSTSVEPTSTDPVVIRNLVANGGFADGLAGYETEGSVSRSPEGHPEAGCAALGAEGSAPGGRKRQSIGNRAAISQTLFGLDQSTRYTVQFFYLVVTSPARDNVCQITAFLGSNQFFSAFIMSNGPSISWNMVLVQVDAPAAFAPLGVAVACQSGGLSLVLVDSIFLSNLVTPATIGDAQLDFGTPAPPPTTVPGFSTGTTSSAAASSETEHVDTALPTVSTADNVETETSVPADTTVDPTAPVDTTATDGTGTMAPSETAATDTASISDATTPIPDPTASTSSDGSDVTASISSDDSDVTSSTSTDGSDVTASISSDDSDVTTPIPEVTASLSSATASDDPTLATTSPEPEPTTTIFGDGETSVAPDIPTQVTSFPEVTDTAMNPDGCWAHGNYGYDPARRLEQVNGISYLGCKQRCLARPECKAIIYYPDFNGCGVFDITKQELGFTPAQDMPNVVADRGCLEGAPTDSAPTDATTTVATEPEQTTTPAPESTDVGLTMDGCYSHGNYGYRGEDVLGYVQGIGSGECKQRCLAKADCKAAIYYLSLSGCGLFRLTKEQLDFRADESITDSVVADRSCMDNGPLSATTATEEPEPTTTTATEAAEPTTADDGCARRGNYGYQPAYSLGWSTGNSYYQCKQKCNANANCQSFLFQDRQNELGGPGGCQLLSVPIGFPALEFWPTESAAWLVVEKSCLLNPPVPTATATTTTTAPDPAATEDGCARRGNFNYQPAFSLDWSTGNTYAQCKQKCKARADCQSILFQDKQSELGGPGGCQLMSVPIGAPALQFFASETASWLVAERSCMDNAAPTPTTTAAPEPTTAEDGCSRRGNWSYNSGFALDWSLGNTYYQCKQKCKALDNCKAFLYQDRTNELRGPGGCQLMAIPIGAPDFQFFPTEDAAWLVAEKSCFT